MAYETISEIERANRRRGDIVTVGEFQAYRTAAAARRAAQRLAAKEA